MATGSDTGSAQRRHSFPVPIRRPGGRFSTGSHKGREASGAGPLHGQQTHHGHSCGQHSAGVTIGRAAANQRIQPQGDGLEGAVGGQAWDYGGGPLRVPARFPFWRRFQLQGRASAPYRGQHFGIGGGQILAQAPKGLVPGDLLHHIKGTPRPVAADGLGPDVVRGRIVTVREGRDCWRLAPLELEEPS